MANFEDECVLYWNQLQYKLSFIQEPNNNTNRFLLAVEAYQCHIFTADIDADLQHQESDQHVCYQAPYVIPTENQDMEVPIALSDKRDKINEENLTNFVDMTPQKPLDPKHVIESDQELLEV